MNLYTMSVVEDAPYKAAVIMLLAADGDVWLALRSASCAVMALQWECPAGKLEEGESYEQGALRELYEETGLRLEPVRLEPCGIVRTRGKGPMDCACALFMAQLREGEKPFDTEPHKRSSWQKMAFPQDLMDLDCTIGTTMLLEILAEDRAAENDT